MNISAKISKSAKAVSSAKRGFKPEYAIVAGSGLSGLKNYFTVVKTLPYSKIPFFSKTTAEGHLGELNFCSYAGVDFLILNGRFHLYEGYSPQEVTYPVRVMNALGVNNLIITAACGALNKKYSAEDIVIMKDQINFTGNGLDSDGSERRFIDAHALYDASFRKKALAAAKKYKIKAREGVYFGVKGPAYETPAESAEYRRLGGDMIGMSVVMEALAASQMKMKTLGLAYISNRSSARFRHEDVLKAGKSDVEKFSKIIKECLK